MLVHIEIYEKNPYREIYDVNFYQFWHFCVTAFFSLSSKHVQIVNEYKLLRMENLCRFMLFLFFILISLFMGGKNINFSTAFHIFYDVVLMLKSSIDIAYIHIYAVCIVFINWECRSKFPNKSQFSLSFCYLKIKSFKEDEIINERQ